MTLEDDHRAAHAAIAAYIQGQGETNAEVLKTNAEALSAFRELRERVDSQGRTIDGLLRAVELLMLKAGYDPADPPPDLTVIKGGKDE